MTEQISRIGTSNYIAHTHIHILYTVECNYLLLPLTPASDTHVIICSRVVPIYGKTCVISANIMYRLTREEMTQYASMWMV